MDESELEPDPRRRVPTVLWLLLGIGTIVAFTLLVLVLLGHGPPHAVGPPAGQP